MSLLSLREALNRSKDKWKKRFSMGSKSTTTGATDYPSASRDAWHEIRSLLDQLEFGAGVFGPLKSVIGGLIRCIDAYEQDLSDKQREYKALRNRVGVVLKDIAEYMNSPMVYTMTDSVKLICADIEIELKVVEERQGQRTGRKLVDAMDGLDRVTEGYERIQQHLERLTLNLNLGMLKGITEQAMELKLAKLSPSMSAIYNSAESDDIKRGSCTPGTRKPQIDLLLEWAHTPDAGKTCWMNGMAGTGKTTIAYSVCSGLEKASQLGASFFCSRVIPECRQVRRIIPSIAYQLARFSLPFRCALARALELDPDTHTRALRIQYQKLLIDPLTEVRGSLPMDLIVVIDALDECENEDSVGELLDLFLSSAHSLPVRFLVSSRPEREIAQRLSGQVNKNGEAVLVLHDLDSDTVKADIATYLRHELKHIPLDDAQWSSIIASCGVLFIYASTTCRYIKEAHAVDTLDEAVSAIVDTSSNASNQEGGNPIDQLYLTILTAAFESPRMNTPNKIRMQKLLETVICVTEPITTDALAALLDLKSAKQVDGLLQPLRSVLNIAPITRLVATLHASFPDFMLSEYRSAPFHCKPATRHLTIAEACLRIIDATGPKHNICGLSSSYMFDDEVPDLKERVIQNIPSVLTYTCRYWSTHLSLGEYHDKLMDHVRNFFSKRLLLWMEIMSLTKHIGYGMIVIRDAEKWCYEKAAPVDITKLVHDAWEFVSVYANHPIRQSTPHIYTSMLPFWPSSRPVSTIYMPRTAGLVKPKGSAMNRRRLALLATWNISSAWIESIGLSADGTRLVVPTEDGIDILDTTTGNSIRSLTNEHTKNIRSVTISPDGSRVAFGSRHSALQLWSINDGDNIIELLPSLCVGIGSIAFSPDGSSIACGLSDGDLYIHVLQPEARILGPLKGHTRHIHSVAFSPDGLYLASGSWGDTIRIWDVRTGKMAGQPFDNHASYVLSLCFSPDGSCLASSSSDGTVRIWDLKSGLTPPEPLSRHLRNLKCIAFSPNGVLVACGSADKTIRVYDAHTGQTVLGPLEGHTDEVDSIIFFPDSSRIFSCSRDGTIRIWNVEDLATDGADSLSTSLVLPQPIYSIRYSHDGLRVASGSENGDIHVWNAETGELVLGPLCGHRGTVRSLDYSSKNTHIASASADYTVRIWDTETGKDIHGPMRGHTGQVACVRFSPDGSIIASGSIDCTLRLWDIASGREIGKFFQEELQINSVGFSPNGQQIALGIGRGSIAVIDRHTCDILLGPIVVSEGGVHSAEFSPDGAYILSGSYYAYGAELQLSDVQTGQQLIALQENDTIYDTLLSASFSPNSRYITSCYANHRIHVWDVQAGKPILNSMRGHIGKISCLQFSPDNSHVVSCSHDQTIRFWDVSSCKTSVQEHAEMEAADSDHEAATTQDTDDNSSLNSLSLEHDGWVIDSQDRRLIWVPSDLHLSLALPPNDLVISEGGCFKLDLDGAKFGEAWAECYQP
ncbi:ribosomal large subunit assembly [Rhizoctonia solani]|uniref:Ribosomal large subunit assembly n=1 Tax=Rhizoctonia solani TaxID=456999 RepID=A0A8H7LQM0_9AGAM|nr:ribosomal large subunit assembly [Rhizoctonia solani]